jgi:hypothetical protein
VGTFPNQTYPGTSTPEAAVTNGDSAHGDVLSYLPGQRLCELFFPFGRSSIYNMLACIYITMELMKSLPKLSCLHMPRRVAPWTYEVRWNVRGEGSAGD